MTGYAVRNDRASWRAVDSPEQIDADEFYCADNPPSPAPSAEELASLAREWRAAQLSAAMWLRERHRDQLEVEAPTSIDAGQFKELLVYMQTLRDWPQSSGFPDARYRPTAPSWITQQTE